MKQIRLCNDFLSTFEWRMKFVGDKNVNCRMQAKASDIHARSI